MSSVFVFYFNVLLTGVAIAAASTYFAALVGAPAPRIYPVIGHDGRLARAMCLWILSGPIALMRFVVRTTSSPRSLPFLSAGALVVALAIALLWAFCLGVLLLELVFQIFQG